MSILKTNILSSLWKVPSSEVTFIPASILEFEFFKVNTFFSPVALGLAFEVVVTSVGFCSTVASILGILLFKVSYPCL